MSLGDELTESVVSQDVTGQWVQQWVSTLSTKDKKDWEEWTSDPNRPAAAIFRVVKRHGFSGAESTFRHWLRKHRESVG